MDFAKLKDTSAIAAGIRHHIKHPATGEPMFDQDAKGKDDKTKPCVVIVGSIENDDVIAATRKASKARVGDKLADDADAFREAVKDAVPLIFGFENVNRDGKPATLADAAWFLGLFRPNGNDLSFFDQVSQTALDRSKIMGNGSKA